MRKIQKIWSSMVDHHSQKDFHQSDLRTGWVRWHRPRFSELAVIDKMRDEMLKSSRSKNLELAKLANPIYGKRSIIQGSWDSRLRTGRFHKDDQSEVKLDRGILTFWTNYWRVSSFSFWLSLWLHLKLNGNNENLWFLGSSVCI